MAVTLDATLGGSASNSYIDLAVADGLAANLPGGADWVANTSDEDRSLALITATMWLETLNYKGDRCSPSTDDPSLPQRLKWPRSGITCDGVVATCSFIPDQIKVAEVLLAIQYTSSPSSFPGAGADSAPAGTYVKRQKLDVLEIEYAQFTGNSVSGSCDDCDDPAIIQSFGWLADLLGCWVGPFGSNREIRLYRN